MISPEEIWQEVSQITTAYPIYECDKCAIAIMQWLDSEGVSAVLLLLRTANRRDAYITSNRQLQAANTGADESITLNGKHYGVEVMGKVFDNISREGLPREVWISDFNCRSGRFIVEEISVSSLTI